MTRPTLVLLVGAPRSGTTWLQALLAAHPSVASPQETDLFSRFVRPLRDSWRRPLRGGPAEWAAHRYKGLPGVLTADEFTDLVRSLTGGVLDGIIRLRPGASVIVEKSPSHALCIDVIHEYAPEARVVHLVRDGRDVAASLVAASAGWGSGWAPGSLRDAARRWAEHVRGARRAADLGLAYHELRYEQLSTDGLVALRNVFAFCDLEVDDAECARLLAAHDFDAMAGAGGQGSSILVGGEFAPYADRRREPEGFFRRGEVGGWRAEWYARDRLLFRAVAGDLLVELGYEPDDTWAATPLEARTYDARTGALHLLAGAARRVGRLGDRISGRLP